MARVVVTRVQEIEALPFRSVVVAHWEDGSQPDFTAIRGSSHDASQASIDGVGVMGTIAWQRMLAWGAVITVKYDASI